jgi:YHS domain-containing protein
MTLAVTLVCQFSATACQNGKCDPANCARHKAMMQHGDHQAAAEATEMALDPICGMEISKAYAAETVEYKGQTYYFCMEDEKEAFLSNPEKYLKEN